MTQSIQIQFFLGFHQTSEIKMHLSQSPLWKEATLLHNNTLLSVKYEDKEYLGLSLPSPLQYDEIKKKEKDLKDQIQYYCPKLQLDKSKIYLFSQLYLS